MNEDRFAEGRGRNPNPVMICHCQEVRVFRLLGRACTTAERMLDISSVVRGRGVDSELLRVALFLRLVAVMALLSTLPRLPAFLTGKG